MKNQAIDRRRMLMTLMAGGIAPLATACSENSDSGSDQSNALLWAVAWKQTAAEYRALCYQAYNVAKMQVDTALAGENGKPLAVIADLDDTVLHAGSYWGYLVEKDREFFDDAIWDQWVPKNLVTAVPGALAFLEYCRAQGVEVFYVTSRDQGERSFEFALGHLRHLGFPFADPQHLTVFRETSDKSPAREKIERGYEVVVLIGDNLNDFKRDYYLKDVDARRTLIDRDRAEFGRKFIVLP
ncbi:MAG: acid phosphatase, partial [Gammaproteobacteria bacterium]|nr:acid phosphatase [Gammaproteobacteria bacterium]